MIRTIFALLSTAITIYTILCFIRIILTWIPTLSYSKIKGEKKNLGTLYIAKKENPKHTQGSEYVVYTDEGKTTVYIESLALFGGVEIK